MEAKEKDLVMLRLPGCERGYTNVWFRVMFIDNDGTFIGKCEKREWYEDEYKLGEDSRFDVDKILRIYQEGEEFCYSDGVTICECQGLCRINKIWDL